MVRTIIEDKIDQADCGLYFTGNTEEDETETIFGGKFFVVDICYDWSYFEVFGASAEEAAGLREFYQECRERLRDERRRKLDGK